MSDNFRRKVFVFLFVKQLRLLKSWLRRSVYPRSAYSAIMFHREEYLWKNKAVGLTYITVEHRPELKPGIVDISPVGAKDMTDYDGFNNLAVTLYYVDLFHNFVS